MQENLMEVKVLKFADDTKLYCAISDPMDVTKLQANLDTLGNWFKQWKMPVNVSKSGIVTFGSNILLSKYTLYGEPLKEVPRERDLGILMDSTLIYKQHIQKIVNEAMKRYGWMVRNLVTRDRHVIIRIYKTMVRPILEYASSVWSPYRVGLINQIERVQRKVNKLVLRHLSYPHRLELLKLPTLKWRRYYLDLLKVHAIVHGNQQTRK